MLERGPAIAQIKAKVQVNLNQTGEAFSCGINETLLEGMTRLGRKGIPAGCLNGGCGVCKIKVHRGEYLSSGPVSRDHVTEEESVRGITLACRVVPRTDIDLEVIGKMQKSFLSQFGKSCKN